jgi:hypothetical protein
VAPDGREEVPKGQSKIARGLLLTCRQNRFAQAFRQPTGSGLGMCADQGNGVSS